MESTNLSINLALNHSQVSLGPKATLVLYTGYSFIPLTGIST
jgi:hypothetical protein